MNEKKNRIDMNDDPELLERTNPVFNTAKMTLFQLAMLGNPYASAIAEKMKLTYEETQKYKSHRMKPEQELAFKIVLETRYRTMGLLAEHSGCPIVADMPCGYTPRAIEFSEKGIPYIGMDLPAVISEMDSIIPPMIEEENRSHIRFAAVDATNYASLKAALEGEKGEICILTEGLLLYLSDSELQALLSNIKKLLEEHGGCWITADPEVETEHMLILKAITGSRSEQARPHVFQEKADVQAMNNALSVRHGHEAEDTQRATAQLAEYGLRAERLAVADHMPEISALSLVTEDQKKAILKAMEEVAYWKITSAAPSSEAETAGNNGQGFRIRSALKDGVLHLQLSGRLDTLSAPQLLEVFESRKTSDSIKQVLINCKALKYISSAGLRVLLIMHKECRAKVALTGVDPAVDEILIQSGFNAFLEINGAAEGGATASKNRG